jgi:transcriptional regulator with XRE-family HTH domain
MTDLATSIRSAVRAVVYGQMDERIRMAAFVIHADIERAQAEQTDWRPADGCLSDLVASRIRVLRKGLGLTRAELAERFNRLAVTRSGEYLASKYGDSMMTDSVVTNIESGRRTGGSRRRMVTVDEVVVFAKALEVTPDLLMDPASQHPAWLEGEAS